MSDIGGNGEGAAAAGGAGEDQVGIADSPIPFIRFDDDAEDKFVVNQEAMEYIRSLDGPVAVVSIAGMYRTGKSYLLNRLMGRSGGFQVGPTVKACTKGLWLWGRALTVGEGRGRLHVLFMDTEGLGSPARSESYDTRVFALALLLSSYFIYNSTGTIDGSAVSKLSVVVNLTKHIHVQSQAAGAADAGTDYAQFFPRFMWTVRDFGVKLERDGRRISSSDYLEDALRPEDGLSEATDRKNRIRKMIRSFFPERDCMTLVRPVASEEQLGQLDSLPLDQLRPEFQAQVKALRRKVMGSVRAKSLYGTPLTGSMLSSLAEAYVTALNSNETPTISTAWQRVVAGQGRRAVAAGVEAYEAQVAAQLTALAEAEQEGGEGQEGVAAAGPAVLSWPALSAIHSAGSTAARRAFGGVIVRSDAGGEVGEFEARLDAELQQRMEDLGRRNEHRSAETCAGALDALRPQLAAARQEAGESLAAAGGGGGGGEGGAAGKAPAVAEALRIWQTALCSIAATYCEGGVAAGPAMHRVLAEFLASDGSAAAVEVASEAQECVAQSLRAARGKATALHAEVQSLQSRAEATEDRLKQLQEASAAEAAAAATAAAREKAHLESQLADARAEAQRAETRSARQQERAEADLRAAVDRADKAEEEARAQRVRVDEQQEGFARRLEERLDAAEALAAERAKTAQLERQLGELRTAAATNGQAGSSQAQRCADLERQVDLLTRQTELLQGAVDTQKASRRQAEEQREELEYQWGTTKAQFAELQGQRSELDAEVETLRSVALTLKRRLMQLGKLGSVRLDPMDADCLRELGE